MRPVRWLRRTCRWTVRVRLTLVYGALFFVCGAAMLTVVYLLFRGLVGTATLTYGNHRLLVSNLRVTPVGSAELRGALERFLDGTGRARTVPTFVALHGQHAAGLHGQLVDLGVVLAATTAVALGLGWVVAGRMLRPLRTMTRATRAISARNLHERLASTGPHDELRELADTFDGLLARLEAAFDGQRRFVRHASHELRTPITRQRTLVEVAIADPEASVASLREMGARILATSEEQERLIEGLLTLARTSDLLLQPVEVDLSAIAAEVLELRAAPIETRRLDLTTMIEPATVPGDAGLVERLVANVVDNAIEHNGEGGSSAVAVAPCRAGARLSVVNSGRRVRADEVEALLQPLEHHHGDSRRARGHHGLGLAIVQAIASVHGASFDLSPRATGGLEVVVEFKR